MKSRPTIPRSERERQARTRALHALSAMRRGASMSHAARENGVTVRTMKRYVGTALLQDRPGGRIRAAKNDRLLRSIHIPGADGPIAKTVRGSKAARDLAKYQAAVNRLLRGDRTAMADWHGKKIAGVNLITSASTLIDLARKELLPYSPYRAISGGAA